MGSTDVRVDSLDISFRNERVLRSIDLEIEDGEFCVIVGPSGCGKSTLLQTIAGLTTPDGGRVFLRGEDAGEMSVQDRDLGYVFQEFEDALFPHMSVGENIAFGVRQQSDSVDEAALDERIDDLLAMLAIPETKDDLPSALSGGQQQRVELARQLIRECETMLLDDPLADLDYKLQKQMELEMRQIHEDLGSTFVYVTHNQDQALKLADKLVVMNQGMIEQVGTPADVYNEPETAFVGQFVGDSNPVRATVRETDGDSATVDTSFGTVTATNVNHASTGAEGILLLRPETITIGDDASDEANTLDASPVGSTYMGEQTEIALALDGYDRDFYVIRPDMVPLDRYGETIQIGWSASDAKFFEELSVTQTLTVDDMLRQ